MASSQKTKTKLVKIPNQHILAINVIENVEIKIQTGSAEIFFSPLNTQQKYVFDAVSYTFIPIYSFNGCEIDISSQRLSYQLVNDQWYARVRDLHQVLFHSRKNSESIGPRVLVLGPTDSGKTVLSQMLINLSIQTEFFPILVDIDVGQNCISPPGSISFLLPTQPYNPLSTFHPYGNNVPCVYHYGAKSPGSDLKLYLSSISHLSQSLFSSLDKAGCIINSCGWITGEARELIINVIKLFQVTLVVVIHNQDLYKFLTTSIQTSIIFLEKNNFVQNRTTEIRRNSRSQKIYEYFNGPNHSLLPYIYSLSFNAFTIYKFTSFEAELVTPSIELDMTLLAVSSVQEVNQILSNPIIGYIIILNVDLSQNTARCVFPAPLPLPFSNTSLILCEIEHEIIKNGINR